MQITIPKRYLKYVEALFETGILKGNDELTALFKQGLDDVLEDLDMGAGRFPPDLSLAFLRGPHARVEIPYELSVDEKAAIERIQNTYSIRRGTILMTFFLWALFDQWLILKGTERYKQDSRFRKMIDAMPHDSCFEGKSEDETLSQ